MSNRNQKVDKREEAVERAPRIPMQQGMKLRIPEHLKEEGFHYRFFQANNMGRIDSALAAWWEPVKDENNNPLIVRAGLYPMHAMKLPEDLWQEDQRAKEAKALAPVNERSKLAPDEYLPNAELGQKSPFQKDGDFDPLA